MANKAMLGLPDVQGSRSCRVAKQTSPASCKSISKSLAYQRLNFQRGLTDSQTSVLAVAAEQCRAGRLQLLRRAMAGSPFGKMSRRCRLTCCRKSGAPSRQEPQGRTKLRAMSRAVVEFGGGCALPSRSLNRTAGGRILASIHRDS